ncbi:MAG: hypothetical protein LBR79_02935 [Oscillospiraceae bacterium]|jgi:hypothetical protein|nr:hypothetical protein [Oscillospiraceae bacterium]
MFLLFPRRLAGDYQLIWVATGKLAIPQIVKTFSFSPAEGWGENKNATVLKSFYYYIV